MRLALMGEQLLAQKLGRKFAQLELPTGRAGKTLLAIVGKTSAQIAARGT